MPAFSRSPDGYDRAEVDAQMQLLHAQLQRAVEQLDAAAAELRRRPQQAEPDVAEDRAESARRDEELARVTAERDALSARLTATLSAAATAGRPRRRLPARRTTTDRSATPWLLPAVTAAAVAALVGLTAFAVAQDDDPEPLPAPRPSPAATSSASALSGLSSPQAAAQAPAPTGPARTTTTAGSPPAQPLTPAVVPPGWTPYRAQDGSYALALPPGWRSAGPDRFVSESGLTSLSVRTGPLSAAPTVADVERQERQVAAGRPGYRRLAVRELPFKGRAAALWDFRYGSGASAQQVSDLAVVADGTGYGLRVQSRESAWRFAVPLRDGIRQSFSAPGLT